MVSHYTKLDVIKNILPLDGKPAGDPIVAKNHLRLYNAAYMNDPEEGKALITHAREMKKTAGGAKNVILDFFDDHSGPDDHHRLKWSEREYAIYICSLVLGEDALDLWRLYSDNGKGMSIAIPFSAFEKAQGSNILGKMKSSPSGVQKHGNTPKKAQDEATEIVGPPLLKVKYEVNEKDSALKTLDAPLNAVKKIIDGLPKTSEEEMKKVERIKGMVRVLLSEILYLYKSDHYATEKEVRIMAFHGLGDKTLALDERNPAKIYANTEPFLFKKAGTKIYIGPKAEDKLGAEYEAKFRLAKHDFSKTTNVVISKIPYR
jgi:hypothetical protein